MHPDGQARLITTQLHRMVDGFTIYQRRRRRDNPVATGLDNAVVLTFT